MKLPFSFSLKFVFRMLLPGLFFALGLLPLLQTLLDRMGAIKYTEAAFVVLVILGGWLMVVLDMHIYMLYEGRRYWPKPIWDFFVRLESKRVSRLSKIIETNTASAGDERRQQEARTDLNQYRLDENRVYHVDYPTRLGNIITAYENYPLRIYGMDPPFYWYRLWLFLDKDQREEIDSLQALADSTLYTSAGLYFCGFLCFLYALIRGLNLNWIGYLPSAPVLYLLCLLSFLGGWLIYRGSFHLHAQFGELFKAFFDVYHHKLEFKEVLEQLGHFDSIAASKDAPLILKNWEIWRYLRMYQVRLKNGKVVSPAEAQGLSAKSKEEG
jgi:hypothetical protein